MKRPHWIHKYGHKMDHHLKRALLTKGNARKKQFIRVIVQFKEPLNDKHIHLLRKHLFPHALKDCRRLHMVRSIAATVPADGLKHMCRCRPVHRIYIDRKRRALLNIATPAVGAAAAQRSGWKGRGVTIAILDTGIFPHPDLTQPRNRIIAFKDFVNGRKKPYDDNGHGTHCAGDAAGNGHQSHGKYRGPAPEAKLVGVKVLDKFGMGYDSRIIQGIQWCLDHRKRYGIHVLSLSLGAKAKVPCSKDPLCQAVGKAWQRGLVVTVSAGNSGPKAKTIESPGISPSVITVGATDDQRKIWISDERIARFSSRGPVGRGIPKPDILAPGVSIISLRAPGSWLDRTMKGARVGKWYFTLSGTSMSTPMVAGAVSQLLQKFPRLTPNQVKGILKKHAISLNLNVNTQGSGLLNMRFLAKPTYRP